MTLRANIGEFFHRYFRMPYVLHTVEFRSPKRPRATYVFLHGIGNSLQAWGEVIEKLPPDVRIIGIDLLGFGKSPKPRWAVYDAKTQARSVGVTLFSKRLVQQPILVGHSMGALVAIEVARRYRLIPKELVLCSPPFYAPSLSEKRAWRTKDDILRNIYRSARRHPEQLEKLSPLAVRLGFANKELSITKDNVEAYIAALEACIINQNSLRDVALLQLPITIFYGLFDPVVVKKHIVGLSEGSPFITTKRLNAGHEVMGGYATAVARFLNQK